MENDTVVENKAKTSRKSSKSSDKNPSGEEEQEIEQSDVVTKKEIQFGNPENRPLSSESEEESREPSKMKKPKENIGSGKQQAQNSPKRKSSLSKLFSCGLKSGGKRIQVNINEATNLFNDYMTNINGFTNAALCNLQDGEIYATLPDSFKPNNQELHHIPKIQHKSDEKFQLGGQEFVVTQTESDDCLMGKMSSDHNTFIGIKFNNKLVLFGTWSVDQTQSKGKLITCFNEIIKGKKKA